MIYEVLQGMDIPCVYSHFLKKTAVTPPYIVYIGDGQDVMEADNTHYYRNNRYQVEYYFIEKNESIERELEDLLLDNGYLYDKSEDVYIEDEGVFVIYYKI